MLFDLELRAGTVALLSLALSTTFALVQGNGREKHDGEDDAHGCHDLTEHDRDRGTWF